ncbi:DedA family protein [Sphingomonas sp.]|uniref:DedA family protein n=1 Tax=Sphingomonas sp. TaxID=28214 RepID=UPI002C22B988|nr:DedA family protein [Sphingomonas sp.]HWK34717.1 DedA family protein [Sphingomonas sp.]
MFDWTSNPIFVSYWGIFFLMVLENVIPPVPSEVIMGIAGIAAAEGKLDFTLAVLAGTLGCVVGNLFWYEIGRRYGYQRLKPWVERWSRWLTVEWHDVEKIHGYFQRHGGKTVFFFRFMPFGRTIISLPAGLMQMSATRFILFTAAGSLIWNLLLVGTGYWLKTQFDAVDRYVEPIVIGVVVVLLLIYVWRVATWKPRTDA